MVFFVKIFNNQWVVIFLALFVGAIIGFLVIQPLLKKLENKAIKHKKFYIVHSFSTLSKMSPIFGAVLLLNLLYFIPFTVELKGSFQTTLRILNTIIITFLFAEILVFIYEKYSNRKVEHKASTLFHIIIRILVYSAGILVVSHFLEYDITTMLTALGVGGLAIALALQNILSNLFSGMQIIVSKQLKTGDYIKIEEGVEGYVLDINWMNTSLRTRFKNIIIVPNSKVSSTVTTNYSTFQKNLYFQVMVGVHYDSNLEFVEEVTLEVAKEVLSQYSKIPKSFTPRVRFYEFAASSINFKVWLVSDSYENQFLIRHHFIKTLQLRYNKEGIIIPFPIRTLYMQKD